MRLKTHKSLIFTPAKMPGWGIVFPVSKVSNDSYCLLYTQENHQAEGQLN